MILVRRYCEQDESIWNRFNAESKNSLFMFDRKYMDYHKDRFLDHSLIFYNDDKIVALLPMCERDNVLYSHGGLTYGGFITDSSMKQHTMNDCFDELIKYAKENSFTSIVYKCIPHIYHKLAAEEDRYSLYAHGAHVATIDASTYLDFDNMPKMPKGRKAQISRARREGVEVRELFDAEDYNTFIDLENSVLSERHDTKAVHSGAELKLLHDNFPQNIHLFGAFKENKMIAGTVLFEYDSVIHTQYMAANEEARTIGALDLTISTVIEIFKPQKKWLDFGISTEHGKIYLNEGLISQKEGFGGRTGVYEIWNIEI